MDAYLEARGLGIAVTAPFKVKVGAGRYREPDIAVRIARQAPPLSAEAWDGADLVIEILSDSNRLHDLETKRPEYARAGIPEYWIVDPREQTITVLTQREAEQPYAVHGVFGRADRATSVLIPGFEVNVAEVFDRKPGRT